MPIYELVERLGADLEKGLSEEKHAELIQKHGENLITPPPQLHPFLKFLLLFVGGFQLMMMGGGVLCFVVYAIDSGETQNLALGIVLFVVVIASAIFQQYQEGKSDDVMNQLRKLTAEKVFALRGGSLIEVPAASLVPGDIVTVKVGEKMPADVRVLEASDFKVNNAPLTGEAVDIRLGVEANADTLYEAKNIARSGCNCTSGSGKAIVFATGDNTYFGRIARDTTGTAHPDTLMKREIKRLIFIMGLVASVLGITFLILALFNGYTWQEAIIFLISIIVANVPEGLLPQITVALALCAQRMYHIGVLVTNLEIVETLGAVTVICSDKTGTLTQNRMTVSHVVYDKKIHITEHAPIQAGDNFEQFDPNSESFKLLVRILSLNTDAIFLKNADGSMDPDVFKREVKGDASEAALIKFAQPIADISESREQQPRVFCIPFNSANKWMLSINEKTGATKEERNKKPLEMLVKGAPERVLDMCKYYLVDGKRQEMTQAVRGEIDALNIVLAKRGERVLAFGTAELDRGTCPPGFEYEGDPPNFPFGDFTYVGFVSMIDPPRKSVLPAVRECHQAGIKVFMVTGDHPITARSIAKSLDLITKPTLEELQEDGVEVDEETYREAVVVHGTEIEEFTQADWDFVLEHKEIVFARTMPHQKQEIVRQLQQLGHVVAMTGDGVNDAPALKKANVGIAMGSGTAVAKEAAQVMLMEDDFGAIVGGVREGRLIFDNLKKCIAYVLSSNVPEIIPFLIFIAAKIPLGIETIVILTIDLGTDLAPAVSLAFEEPEAAIMMRRPRKATDHLVGPQLMCIAYGTIGLFQTFAAYFAWCYVFIDRGFNLNHLLDSAVEYRTNWKDLDQERMDFYQRMCRKNEKYMALGLDCQNGFTAYRHKTLEEAQAAYLATVVWSQIANVLIRKTQIASIFNFDRLFGNTVMLGSLVSELVILFCIVYIPGLNTGFLMYQIHGKYLFAAFWIIPFVIIWDEARKFLCRRDLKGFFNRYSNF